jgi:hypothetical protein
MDKITEYRRIILELINEYYRRWSSHSEIELYPVVDRDGDHYQILRDGWRNYRRYYGCVLHFDIKDGKIWVRHNGTEDDVAAMLVERGVPKTDIVLAFHSPDLRKRTEFAVM